MLNSIIVAMVISLVLAVVFVVIGLNNKRTTKEYCIKNLSNLRKIIPLTEDRRERNSGVIEMLEEDMQAELDLGYGRTNVDYLKSMRIKRTEALEEDKRLKELLETYDDIARRNNQTIYDIDNNWLAKRFINMFV